MSNKDLEKWSSLLSNPNGATPELCDELGEKAAQLAVDARMDLSDAVVKVASEQPGLKNTHINNICWYANNEYFRKLAAARKEAGEDLTFQFKLAEPPDVVKRLNSMSQPKLSFVQDRDYTESPPHYAGAYNPQIDPFTVKEARVVGRLNPLEDLAHLRESVTRVAEDSTMKAASAHVTMREMEDRLYRQFKQAAVAGTPLGHVVDLLASHPDGESAVASELRKLASKLAKEEPLLYKRFAKTAGIAPKGQPDPTHPLMSAYADMRASRKDHMKLAKLAQVATNDARYVLYKEQEALRQGLGKKS